MNATLTTIYTRRAVRKYKDQAVPRELIEQVIDAGRMAPSAVDSQSWRFYVLTDKKKILTFSKAIKAGAEKGIFKWGRRKVHTSAFGSLSFSQGDDFFKQDDFVFHGAPVVIFITTPKDDEWGAVNTGACAQNMMLAAKSLGLDSCPVGIAKFVEFTDVYDKLGVGADEKVNLAIIIGYGDGAVAAPVRSANNVTYL